MSKRVAEPYKDGRGPKPKSIAEKLAAKAERRGDCLIWTGPVDKDGYGKVPVGSKGHVRVHRAAWIEENGLPPEDKPFILHRCDVRNCIEVSHLYPGTQADNMRDRKARTGYAGTGRKVQTHCREGHKYTGKKNSRGHNLCQTCQESKR